MLMDMKKHHITTLILIIVIAASCDTFTKPHVILSDNQPYQLTIADFNWNYGVTEVNKFSGDFETLDQKVFNTLQNKQGTCVILLKDTFNDHYGQPHDTSKTIGTVNLTELNRFKSWIYWHNDGGIQKMIYKFLFPPADSASTPSASSTNNVGNRPAFPIADENKPGAVYFAYYDLYQDTTERNSIRSLLHVDSGLYKLTGVITGVYPSRSTIKIHTDDIIGDHLVRVYPYKANSEQRDKLISMLRVGNLISSLCTSSLDDHEQLVSAEISSNK